MKCASGELFEERIPLLRQDSGDAVKGALHVFGRGLPVADADAHGATFPPSGIAEKSFSIGEDHRCDMVGKCIVIELGGVCGRVQEAHQPLINLRLRHNLRPRQAADPHCKPVCMVAAAVN